MAVRLVAVVLTLVGFTHAARIKHHEHQEQDDVVAEGDTEIASMAQESQSASQDKKPVPTDVEDIVPFFRPPRAQVKTSFVENGLLFPGQSDATQILQTATTCSGTFLATFNIQNFGVTKAGRSAVLQALAEIVARYDIVAIQELSQMPGASGVCGENTASAICDLLEQAKLVSSRPFSVVVSPRGDVDEQYAVIYDSSKVTYVTGGTYADPENIHSRPPHVFVLQVGDARMAIAQTHTSPRSATAEIQNMPSVINWMETAFAASYNLIVGDYNADGSYFKEDKKWARIMHLLPDYALLTGNELDTTVATSDNTYDRIIATSSLSADPPAVFVIETHIDLAPVKEQGCAKGYVPSSVCSSSSPVDWVDITKELSDHYPVELCIQKNTGPTPEPGPTLEPTSAQPTPVPTHARMNQAGDCAVVGFHATNPEQFGILVLSTIYENSVVFVTDNGAYSDGRLRRGEGILSMQAQYDIPPGTVLNMTNVDWIKEEGRFQLSTTGDQILVFTNSIDVPLHMCALNFERTPGGWQSDAKNTHTSALPKGLVDGVTAFALDEVNNAAYTGPTYRTIDELAMLTVQLQHWKSSDDPERVIVPSTFKVMSNEYRQIKKLREEWRYTPRS